MLRANAHSADCFMQIQAGLSCLLSARVKCLACRRPFRTAPTAGFVASAPAADLERFAGPPFCGEPCVGSATASLCQLRLAIACASQALCGLGAGFFFSGAASCLLAAGVAPEEPLL